MFIPKIPWLFDLIFWALYVIIVTKATDFELFMFKLNTAFFKYNETIKECKICCERKSVLCSRNVAFQFEAITLISSKKSLPV